MHEDQELQLAPAPLVVKVHMLHEAPPPYLGLVLWPCLDLGVGIYPKLGRSAGLGASPLTMSPNVRAIL